MLKDITLIRLTKFIADHGLTIRILFITFALSFVTSGSLLIAHYWDWRVESVFSTGAVLSVGVFFLYLVRYFIRPIQQLIKDAERIGGGEFDRRIAVPEEHEIGRLALSINNMTELLEQRLGEVSLLSQISRESTLSRNLNKVLDLILEKAISSQKADAGSIMLIDKNKGDLVIKVAHNLNPEIRPGTRVPMGDGIAGWVAREGRPIVLIDGIGSDSSFLHAQNVKNAVSLPVLLDHRAVAVLNLSYGEGVDGKRFDPAELGFLTTLANHAASAINNAQLFEELRSNYFSTIEALATAIEAKDPYTHGHSARVAEYAMATAQKLEMSESEIEMMQAAAYLHDVGKIGIPEPILSKPGKLTDSEFEIIKTHPEISARILSPVNFDQTVVLAVKFHHERIDGHGYPKKMKGEAIPLSARILAVADSFDAMTSARPYRPAIGYEDAKAELLRCAGTQFDHRIVDAFLETMAGREELIDSRVRTPEMLT